MTYTKTTWSNETPAASPVKYTIKLEGGTIINDDVLIELKTAVTPGTPLNSTNMNHIEQGIYDAHQIIAPKTRNMLIVPVPSGSLVAGEDTSVMGHFVCPADFQSGGSVTAVYISDIPFGSSSAQYKVGDTADYGAIGQKIVSPPEHRDQNVIYDLSITGLFTLTPGTTLSLANLAVGDFVRLNARRYGDEDTATTTLTLIGWLFQYTASM